MPVRMYRRIPITKERLLKKVNEVSGPLDTPCWEWQGCKNKVTGYGIFEIGGRETRKAISTHRASYELWVGPIPEGLSVLHKCDNRSCINPDHLFVGTQTDNMKDMVAKRRHNFGEKNGHNKLTEEKVTQIRFMLSTNEWTLEEIAEKFGIHLTTVWKIKRRKIWKHLQNRVVWSTPTITEVFGAEKQRILEELGTTQG